MMNELLKDRTFERKLTPLLERLRGMDDGRMADVVEARFGILDGREHTLEEIGQSLGGLTRERIRQIEGSALRFLQRFAEEAGCPWVVEKLKKEVKDAAHEAARSVRRQYRTSSKPTLFPKAPPTVVQNGPPPTIERLSALKNEVELGMAQLESLGISI